MRACRTYYCSTKCQSAHKKIHDGVCINMNIRKELLRSGELLKTIFFQLRKATYDIKVRAVGKNEQGTILVFEDEYAANYGDGPLYPFPRAFADGSNEERALLAYLSCSDIFIFLDELSKSLLGGITTVMQEADFGFDQDRFLVRRISPYGRAEDHSRYMHSALAIEAKDGEAYIVDVSGAQYGQHQTVVPFGQYMSDFATKIIKITSHGHMALKARAVHEGYRDRPVDISAWMSGTAGNFDYRPLQMQYKVKERILAAVKEWEMLNNLTLHDLLGCDQERFEACKSSLLAKTDDDVRSFLAKWEEDGCKLEPRVRKEDEEAPSWVQDLRMDEDDENIPQMSELEEQSRASQRYSDDKKAECSALLASRFGQQYANFFKGL
ncbi:Hypothetical predicted protein [Lecanosticta acicola]|uniref:Uncharacterized protein n=1 Tax=Lecanosticta acicola TaxID=111012 RepID=A0AAI8Z604_9PEZI|nr:Hypothetical predicted protein [Lecanosticta acicola]